MNKFINTIKYTLFALVLVSGFSFFISQASAVWVDVPAAGPHEVEYEVVSIVVHAGPDKGYSLTKLASGEIVDPVITLTLDDVNGVFVEDKAKEVASYQWVQLPDPYGKPPVVIENGTTLTPTFKNLSKDYINWEENVYAFKLRVYNAAGQEIIVIPDPTNPSDDPNPLNIMYVHMTRERPRALAELTDPTKETITLPAETNKVFVDGTRSKDYDQVGGGINAYEWIQTSGPAGANIKNPDQAITEITNLKVGNYRLQLKVTDNDRLYDETDWADDPNDVDSPYFDDITITVEGVPPEPRVYLEIDPECEIPLYGVECPSFPGGTGEGAYWWSENMDVTSMELFDKLDLSNPLDTSFSRSSDDKLSLMNLTYPSRTFRLVAKDDDPATNDIVLEDTVVAKCVDGSTWGGNSAGCIPLAPVNGVCDNSVKNACSAGTFSAGGANTWTCLGENGGDDDSCTYNGGPGGLYECNDTVDNNDPEDTLADAADPSCHTSCDATQNDYVPTYKESRYCKKPIYKNF